MFTRQFTAFDRQNVESAKSPFHGFFALFWLGTAIFMTQIAVKNYVAHGNVLAGNEILQQMRQSDLMLLAISDGVLWLTTGFGWTLQMMVARGWIRWNREGWIIQHVSTTVHYGTMMLINNRSGKHFICLLSYPGRRIEAGHGHTPSSSPCTVSSC